MPTVRVELRVLGEPVAAEVPAPDGPVRLDAVLPLLRQLCSFGGISNELEYAVIGLALLIGTVVDEVLKRRAARRTG